MSLVEERLAAVFKKYVRKHGLGWRLMRSTTFVDLIIAEVNKHLLTPNEIALDLIFSYLTADKINHELGALKITDSLEQLTLESEADLIFAAEKIIQSKLHQSKSGKIYSTSQLVKDISYLKTVIDLKEQHQINDLLDELLVNVLTIFKG